MELISGFFFVVIIGIISYVFSKKEVTLKENNEITEVNHKELERRKKIVEQVDNFLSGALYLDHMGNWNKEKVYKYIFNENKLYEFHDFMTDDNQKIGIDDSWLCFKKMSYKRNQNNISIIESKIN